MKKTLFILLIIVFSCDSQKENLIETTDYLEYIIKSNPPFESINTKFKYFKSDTTNVGSRFIYNLDMVDENGKMINSKISTVYIDEIKNIIIEESIYDNQKRFDIRLGLKGDMDSESFAVSLQESIESKKILELRMVIPNDRKLAEKIKNAIVELGKLNEVKIKNLDIF